MNVNIVLGVSIAIVVFITSGLGGHLASTKSWHKWIFWCGGLLALALITIQTVLNERSQQELEQHLAKIQHNTEVPPTVTISPQINVPAPSAPKEHTRVNWLVPAGVKSSTGTILFPLFPFHRDQEIALNMGYNNGGDFTIRNARMKHLILVVPMKDSHAIFHQHQKALQAAAEAQTGILNPHTGEIKYHTVYGPTLTDDDVANLDTDQSALCVIGIIRWEDDSGSYATDLSDCLIAESPQGGFNWHVGPETDAEHKLP